MKYRFRYLLFMLVVTLCSLHSAAEETPNDTVYFYDTWQQMLYMEPMGMAVNPPLYAITPYEVYFDSGDIELDQLMEKQHLAISIGDSIWLISSHILKEHFKGDVKNLSGFVPVFFNEKVAYLTYNSVSLKDILFGNYYQEDENRYRMDFYYIDFINRVVKKVTPSYLSELLEDYHNLQMRYEGMKDYKKQHIIQDYFYKFVDQATQDFMRPYILDLVESDSLD